MAHVLLVTSRRYNGHEFWGAVNGLLREGHTFEIRSTSVHIQDEVTGKKALISALVSDPVDLNVFDGLMIVSGNTDDTFGYWDNPYVKAFVLAMKDKPIAAICRAVPSIRYVVKGKTVSSFPILRVRELLSQSGAIIAKVSLSVDGNLVTAEHEMMTQVWVEAFSKLLRNEQTNVELIPTNLLRAKERKPIPQLEKIKAIKKATGKDGF